MSMKLPIYELAPARFDKSDLLRVADSLFGLRTDIAERGDRQVIADDRLSVELFPASGTLYAAYTDRLRRALTPPSLPSAERAYELAADLIEKTALQPELGHDDVALTKLGAGATMVATLGKGRRSQHQLEVAARFGVTLANPGVDGEPERIPMVGGGGKLTVTFGDKEQLLGVHSAWRPVTGKRLVDALDRDEALARFAEANPEVDAQDLHAYLAYYAAPGETAQELLTPVWVVGGTLRVGDEIIPMRTSTVAATTFGPATPKSEPQPARERPSSLAAAQTARPQASGNPFEVGTSWIGTLGGLTGSQQNAQGFVDGFAADGWKVNFNWGNANAWESDWDANDDDYVDAADFVFYTGHASLNGWLLVTPGTSNFVTLTPSVVGSVPQTPGDRWGAQDLEWVIVAACGPLQDDVISAGGGDVLTRWEGAFDGLHTLMGYGSITNDNTVEGEKVSRYTREGTPVIDAWFRTGQEVQPSTNGERPPDGPDVWVGAMYVIRPGADPRNDHVWGHGSVSADPNSPTSLVCMWTTC